MYGKGHIFNSSESKFPETNRKVDSRWQHVIVHLFIYILLPCLLVAFHLFRVAFLSSYFTIALFFRLAIFMARPFCLISVILVKLCVSWWRNGRVQAIDFFFCCCRRRCCLFISSATVCICKLFFFLLSFAHSVCVTLYMETVYYLILISLFVRNALNSFVISITYIKCVHGNIHVIDQHNRHLSDF